MRTYLLSVMGTVLLCALITAILPEGKTAGVIKGTAKLACLLAIVAPIPTYLKMENSTEDFFGKSVLQVDESFIQYYGNMRIEDARELLQMEIATRFALQVVVDIEADTDTATLVLNKITVQIEERVEEEVKNSVWEYLTKTYCSEVLIE